MRVASIQHKCEHVFPLTYCFNRLWYRVRCRANSQRQNMDRTFTKWLSKSDVKHWPLVGLLATAGGTLYIERASRRDAMRVVHHMAQSLTDGDILAVFPEGTTGDGTTVLPFHANLLQAAISAQAPVQPVLLQFVDDRTGAPSQAMSYIGNETLLGSVWRTLCAPPLRALVVYGAPQYAGDRDRRIWARDLHAAISAMQPH